MLRKIALLLVLLSGFAIESSAQNFGGIIEFKKQSGTNVTNYVYYVKGDKIRIDEFTPGTRAISGSFVVDTKAGTMIYMDPVRKIWGTRPPKTTAAAAPAGSVASLTKNTKDIFGYKCAETDVKNATDSTEIDYFVAPGKFAFFNPMMKLINRQERISTYCFALGLKEGYMPLLAVEKNLAGVERGRLEVTRLEEKEIADVMFAVPPGYTEVK